MTFRYDTLPGGNYEVIMEKDTVQTGSLGSARKERRFALCTHENDASHIVECLNAYEDFYKKVRDKVEEFYTG